MYRRLNHIVTVHFLGASKTVTGSKFLLKTPSLNILVDCGMFQGLKELRERNWNDLNFNVPSIDVVLLTHGHLDHTGYLPRLIKQGFRGKILGTAPTLAITKIILEDSARIHEEDAKRANDQDFTKHKPALAFYDQKDVAFTLDFFKTVEEREWIPLSKTIKCRFIPVGHIIGATFIEIDINGKIFVFSGDVGRPVDYLLPAPEKPKWADYLFLESTYGDRMHDNESPEDKLVAIVKEIIHTRGTLIIPSFAVERLQALMFILYNLYKENRIPGIPIFIDSPMGTNVLSVFEQFSEWHKLSKEEYTAMCRRMTIVASYKETWEVIDNPRPKIVIAGSGMATGGRVLTYLKQLVDHKDTQILLVGYQAEGTRGRQLQEGAHEIKIHGKYYPVNAQVHQLNSLSAHADQYELLDWTSEVKNIPENVFLIHAEAGAADAFRVKLQVERGWQVHIPDLEEKVELVI